jgi:hypothetical protein
MGGGVSRSMSNKKETDFAKVAQSRSSVMVTKVRQAGTGVEHAAEAEEATKKKLKAQLEKADSARAAVAGEVGASLVKDAKAALSPNDAASPEEGGGAPSIPFAENDFPPVIAMSSHGELPLSPKGDGATSTRRGSLPTSSALDQDAAHNALEQEAAVDPA